MLKNTLRKIFKKAIDEQVDRVIIYYSGHGDRDTGGWITYKGDISMNGIRVTIKEVLDIAFIECKYSNQIEITTDACFSGK